MDNNQLPNQSWMDTFKKKQSASFKSLAFVWHHKKLLFFPLLSATLIFATIGICGAVFYRLHKEGANTFFREISQPREQAPQQSTKKYPSFMSMLELILCLFIIHYGSIFFSIFSNVAFSYALNQSSIAIGQSLVHSITRLPALLGWALFNFLPKERPRWADRNPFLDKFISEHWHIATLLVTPVIAFENHAFLKSLYRSEQLMQHTFGKNLTGFLFLHRAFNFITMIASLFLGISFIGAIAYLVTDPTYNNTDGLLPLIFSGLVIGVLLIIAGFFVSAAITVLKTAVYQYALGTIREPFKKEEIAGLFVPDVIQL